MSELIIPFVFAIVVWWFSTGLILLLDRKTNGRLFKLLLAAVLAVGSFYCLTHVSKAMTVSAVYGSFFCTILIWSWVELSFITGFILGPNTKRLPQGTTGSRRFVLAFNAIAYHELLILCIAASILAVTLNSPNKIALWTFLVLWVMRTSAKLNLFLGVRNLGIEFLPPHLLFLKSFFKKRAMNWLFPFAVGGSTLVTIKLFLSALAPGQTQAQMVGTVLVASLLLLAVIEHWFMVIPWQSFVLWKWALKPNIPVQTISPALAPVANANFNPSHCSPTGQ